MPKVGYAIGHSPLVKTAFFASDPNLGRILAAVGYAGITDLDVDGVKVWLDEVLVAEKGGRAASYKEEDGARVMAQAEIAVRVDLGRGPAAANDVYLRFLLRLREDQRGLPRLISMSDIRRDLTRSTLAILCIVSLIGLSLWVLRPFLAATIWATMLVVATWPLLLALPETLCLTSSVCSCRDDAGHVAAVAGAVLAGH